MKYFFFILLCLLLSQCKVNKSPQEELTLKDSICYIDTSHISSKMKSIIRSYISEYPQYDNLVLMHDNFVVKSIHKDLDIDELYILGPTFTGESYEERIYPASYFTINGKNVFIINSSYDRLINQELCKSVYLKHLEKDMSCLDGVRFWLLKIDRTGSVSLFTKNPDEYLGVDEVKEPATFTAPVSKKTINFYGVIRPERTQLTNVTPNDYVITLDNIVAVNPKSGEFVVKNTERIDTVAYPKKGRYIIMFYSKDSLLFDAKLISALESTLSSGLTFCHYGSDKNGFSRYMLYEIPFVNHDGKTENKSDQQQQQGIQRMYQILEKAGKTSGNINYVNSNNSRV